jgi:hypothetical protein
MMRRLVRGAIVVAAGVWTSASAAPPQPSENSPLRHELLDRRSRDQEARRAVAAYFAEHKGADPEASKAADVPAFQKLREVDRGNTTRMKAIIDRHGWPGKTLVGEEGAFSAWLLVQHADHDCAFQKKCLVLLTEAAKRGEASAAHMAYLTDRVRMGEKRPQVYGTQFEVVAGKLQPYPVEDEANLEQRRREIGLPPMAEYRKMLERTYNMTPNR